MQLKFYFLTQLFPKMCSAGNDTVILKYACKFFVHLKDETVVEHMCEHVSLRSLCNKVKNNLNILEKTYPKHNFEIDNLCLKRNRLNEIHIRPYKLFEVTIELDEIRHNISTDNVIDIETYCKDVLLAPVAPEYKLVIEHISYYTKRGHTYACSGEDFDIPDDKSSIAEILNYLYESEMKCLRKCGCGDDPSSHRSFQAMFVKFCVNKQLTSSGEASATNVD